jgi:hypothetical protein
MEQTICRERSQLDPSIFGSHYVVSYNSVVIPGGVVWTCDRSACEDVAVSFLWGLGLFRRVTG